MVSMKHWTVDVYLDEDVDHTHAEARLRTPDAGDLRAKGSARRNPEDRNVPEIGDELAAARALFELAHRLLKTAQADVERMTGQPAHLHT
ncbi:DUF1876 domain-containing protein [Saccharopolyspora phatthalungensis]|uniref:DUF1876 domain-containing protein n=1 Tax=Saccharopolyspora phatthalungensis TaxID=664693 RepID=A0A840Q7R3_9PSEU|nr:DUF1876 domain-containing protein [Saccharopolyspora phatthalungensis]MBB5158552.1 hypothetical protein [Saccharopolyspora phatthalungensis]